MKIYWFGKTKGKYVLNYVEENGRIRDTGEMYLSLENCKDRADALNLQNGLNRRQAMSEICRRFS